MTILSFGADFPNALLVCDSTHSGYQGPNGAAGNTMMVLTPVFVQQVNDGTIESYNVLYKTSGPQAWSFGSNRQIELTVSDDQGSSLVPPFTNPLIMKIRVIHTAL